MSVGQLKELEAFSELQGVEDLVDETRKTLANPEDPEVLVNYGDHVGLKNFPDDLQDLTDDEKSAFVRTLNTNALIALLRGGELEANAQNVEDVKKQGNLQRSAQ